MKQLLLHQPALHELGDLLGDSLSPMLMSCCRICWRRRSSRPSSRSGMNASSSSSSTTMSTPSTCSRGATPAKSPVKEDEEIARNAAAARAYCGGRPQRVSAGLSAPRPAPRLACRKGNELTLTRSPGRSEAERGGDGGGDGLFFGVGELAVDEHGDRDAPDGSRRDHRAHLRLVDLVVDDLLGTRKYSDSPPPPTIVGKPGMFDSTPGRRPGGYLAPRSSLRALAGCGQCPGCRSAPRTP